MLKKTIAPFIILLFFFLPNNAHAYIGQTNSSASLVIGQPDMTSNLVNQGGSAGANTQNSTIATMIYGTKLFISDTLNHRVLIYNSIPISNNISASVVIGQVNMTSNSANQGGAPAANTLNGPRNIIIAENKLIIADTINHRVLIYDSIPTSNNASANVVIGQPDMVSNSANQGGAVGANTLNSPRGLLYIGGKLLIADVSNNRVLIYNSIPETDDASANVVIGQPDMVSNSANQGGAVAANTMYFPRALLFMDGKLLVSELYNNRVLIFNTIPVSNNASANVVIGQPDMNSNAENQGGSVAANTVKQPHDIFSYNLTLFVSDTHNNRILIYYGVPIVNNKAADAVIGQADFISGSSNQGGSVAANTFYDQKIGYISDAKMFVADSYNHRTLIFNLGPVNTSISAATIMKAINRQDYRIHLSLSATGAYQMMISNYADFREGVWENYSTTKDWTLLGSGDQMVYAKFRDYALYESEPVSVLTNLPQTGNNLNWLYLPLIINKIYH